MRFGYSETCLAHDTGERHPETPDRLRAIRQDLVRRHGVEYVEPTPATEAEVTAIHDPDYVEDFRTFCASGGGHWDPDTVAVERTWDAALASAGLARWAAMEALDGATGRRTPFSLGRPPGHHACSDEGMGFCFLNNAAVAAQAAIDAGAARRIAIVDWDVHHGNGTQEIFETRDDVFYASIHEHGLYPGTGDATETGVESGEGTTLNVPLPPGAGDADYLLIADEVLGPALERFDPELLIVSAGFDAHRHDPISRMRVSTDGFGCLTERLRAVGGGDRPIAFVLEGGYGLDTLADGVGIVHEVFDGHRPNEADAEPSSAVRSLAERLGALHSLDA